MLVVCPRCEACARVLPREPGVAAYAAPRRMVCPACGLAREWSGREVLLGAACDPYFREPLWLTAACCGETLWAYNERHLRLIEQFVAAQLRESGPGLPGWTNRSIANRLPRWIKDGKNREEILKAIARLRERRPG